MFVGTCSCYRTDISATSGRDQLCAASVHEPRWELAGSQQAVAGGVVPAGPAAQAGEWLISASRRAADRRLPSIRRAGQCGVPPVGEKRSHLHPKCTLAARRGTRSPPSGRTKSACVQAKSEWAIQDSNLGPLPYQRSALTD